MTSKSFQLSYNVSVKGFRAKKAWGIDYLREEANDTFLGFLYSVVRYLKAYYSAGSNFLQKAYFGVFWILAVKWNLNPMFSKSNTPFKLFHWCYKKCCCVFESSKLIKTQNVL